MNGELLERFIVAMERKRDLEADLRSVQDVLNALEPALLEEFVSDGLQSCKRDGHTVYIHKQLWASPEEGDYARACLALTAAGLGEMVAPRFNVNTLSAWCRERAEAEEPLPAAFEGAIKVNEKVSLRMRGS